MADAIVELLIIEELKTTYEAMSLPELLALQNQFFSREVYKSKNRLDVIDCSLLEVAIRRKMK